jgi:hypothetical protein
MLSEGQLSDHRGARLKLPPAAGPRTDRRSESAATGLEVTAVTILSPYNGPEGLTGMRGGLAWRLRAKPVTCQRPASRPTSQAFEPVVQTSRGKASVGASCREPIWRMT